MSTENGGISDEGFGGDNSKNQFFNGGNLKDPHEQALCTRHIGKSQSIIVEIYETEAFEKRMT